MAELARRLKTKYDRFALGGLAACWTPSVEASLTDLGFCLSDLEQAILSYLATWTNIRDAKGKHFSVVGNTAEGIVVEFDFQLDLENGSYIVERFVLASGATGDEKVNYEAKEVNRIGAND